MAKNKPVLKKVVLMLVEGFSDKNALQRIMQRIYKNRMIVFEVTKGDITSNESVNKDNVEDRINEIVKNHLGQSKYRRSDIWEIVHLIDTDGVYAPDSIAVAGETKHFYYTPTTISCNKPERIIKRNADKRIVLDHLLSVNDIGGSPYTVYYMSCNLDHVLYDKQNLDIEEKDNYADAFYEAFKGKEFLFIDFIRTDAVNGVPDTSFKETWDYIKTGLHSLERHTNLHYYFVDHPPYAW